MLQGQCAILRDYPHLPLSCVQLLEGHKWASELEALRLLLRLVVGCYQFQMGLRRSQTMLVTSRALGVKTTSACGLK